MIGTESLLIIRVQLRQIFQAFRSGLLGAGRDRFLLKERDPYEPNKDQ
jgi:hypothetical protein